MGSKDRMPDESNKDYLERTGVLNSVDESNKVHLKRTGVLNRVEYEVPNGPIVKKGSLSDEEWHALKEEEESKKRNPNLLAQRAGKNPKGEWKEVNPLNKEKCDPYSNGPTRSL